MWPFDTRTKRLQAALQLALAERFALKQTLNTTMPGSALLPSSFKGQPVRKEWSTEVAIKEGFKASTWVYACVTRLMKAAASVPWAVEVQKSEDRWEVDSKHPMNKLITKPNPFTPWSDLVEMMTALLYLGGNNLFLKVRVNGIPDELWIIRPDKIAPVPDPKEYLKVYRYTGGSGGAKDIPVENIIHVKFIDPSNEFWGLSPLMAAALTVETEIAAVKWNRESLDNRAVPDGALVFKQPLTQPQYDAARQIIREQYDMGGRYPWVLGSDADWKQFSLTAVELDYVASRRLTREEICGIYQVPPPIVGIYDKATLTNIETARVIFWVDTVIPYLNDIVDAMNFSLQQDFGEGVRLAYDIRNVEALHAVFRQKVDTATKLFGMGVPFNTLNQRLRLGFDEVDGGDVGYLPSNLFPATAGGGDSDDGMPPSPPEEEEPDEDTEVPEEVAPEE